MDLQITQPSQKRLALIALGYTCLLIVFSVIATYGVAIGISLLRLLFVHLNLLSLQPSDNAFWLSAYFFGELSLLLTAWLCFHYSIQNKQIFEELTSTDSKIILFGILGAALMFGISLLSGYLTKITYGDLKDPLTERFLFFSPIYRILFAILGSLIAPICEEILFRRALFGVFRQYGYITTGIIFSSLLFALMHFGIFIKMGIFSFVVFFIAGVILAVVYHKTNSILTSIFAHILVNTSGFLLDFYWFT